MSDEHDAEIVHRELDTDAESPAAEMASHVADLEGINSEDLTPAWDCIDDVLDRIFSTPPYPNAQMKITFSYEGYRITVHQNGSAEFVKVRAK